MAFGLRAWFVFPVDRPAIENGVVTIEGERIVAVGAKPQADDVTDLGDVALLPGLVNCHTHLEFSDLRRPLGQPGIPFIDWIRLVIAERGRRDVDASQPIATGLMESSRGGVATIGDIAQELNKVHADTACDLTVLLEVIGFSQARAESSLAAVSGRLHAATGKPNVQFGVSPHAPYTVSPALLNRLVAHAKERTLPVAMHLAESTEELELLATGAGPFQELLEERSMWDAGAIPRGSRPMDYLQMLAGAPRALVIHGNYLDAEEREFLGSRADRMSVVYCPRTHAYFEHPPYPLRELLECGARVGLGTDSRASNPDLNLMEDMRHVARKHSAIDPEVVLRMGTLTGAEALGRDRDVGSITPGKLANLVAAPLKSHGKVSTAEALGEILTGEQWAPRVWLRGVEVSAEDTDSSSILE
jgi:cytosine/adenosine deaminase-related metal-dependent hydrolase